MDLDAGNSVDSLILATSKPRPYRPDTDHVQSTNRETTAGEYADADDIALRAIGNRAVSTYNLDSDGTLGHTTIPVERPEDVQHWRKLLRCVAITAMHKAKGGQ